MSKLHVDEIKWNEMFSVWFLCGGKLDYGVKLIRELNFEKFDNGLS